MGHFGQKKKLERIKLKPRRSQGERSVGTFQVRLAIRGRKQHLKIQRERERVSIPLCRHHRSYKAERERNPFVAAAAAAAAMREGRKRRRH